MFDEFGKVSEFESPFATALVVLLTTAAPRQTASTDAILRAAQSYLETQGDERGAVCYFGESSNYFRDSDDSALVAEARLRVQSVLGERRRRPMLDQWVNSALVASDQVQVWFDREGAPQVDDLVVHANVARYMLLSRHPLASAVVDRLVAMMSSPQCDFNSKISLYYPSTGLALALMFVHDDGSFLESVLTRSELVTQKLICWARETGRNHANAAIDPPRSTTEICAYLRDAILLHAVRFPSQSNSNGLPSTPLCQHINRRITYASPAVDFALLQLAQSRACEMPYGIATS